MQYKVIITGAHGLIGEGVLLQCLENTAIAEVLLISRWPMDMKHAKLKELIIPDFFELDNYYEDLTGYDACFYCAEAPVASIDERIYAHFAIDITLSLATRLLLLNPNIVFSFLSRKNADTTGLDELMSNRIIGKTENALSKLIFRKLYFFRVGMISPLKVQKKIDIWNKVIYSVYPFLKLLMPNKVNTTKEIGLAMINALVNKHPERVVTGKDIRTLSVRKEGSFNISGSLIY